MQDLVEIAVAEAAEVAGMVAEEEITLKEEVAVQAQ
jgi:hypothetical protein